jgi:hypothetical protein
LAPLPGEWTPPEELPDDQLLLRADEDQNEESLVSSRGTTRMLLWV